MQEKTKNLISQLLPKWEEARSLQNRDIGKIDDYATQFSTINGTFSWNNSSLVMLADFVKGACYEEYGSIVGLSKDGKIMWEYQSHCSCNGFDNSSSADGEVRAEDLKPEKKKFELNSLPDDWEEKIQDSMQLLLNVLSR